MSVDIDFISLDFKISVEISADNIWITRLIFCFFARARSLQALLATYKCGVPIWRPAQNGLWSTRETNGLENVVSDHLNEIFFRRRSTDAELIYLYFVVTFLLLVVSFCFAVFPLYRYRVAIASIQHRKRLMFCKSN